MFFGRFKVPFMGNVFYKFHNVANRAKHFNPEYFMVDYSNTIGGKNNTEHAALL